MITIFDSPRVVETSLSLEVEINYFHTNQGITICHDSIPHKKMVNLWIYVLNLPMFLDSLLNLFLHFWWESLFFLTNPRPLSLRFPFLERPFFWLLLNHIGFPFSMTFPHRKVFSSPAINIFMLTHTLLIWDLSSNPSTYNLLGLKPIQRSIAAAVCPNYYGKFNMHIPPFYCVPPTLFHSSPSSTYFNLFDNLKRSIIFQLINEGQFLLLNSSSLYTSCLPSPKWLNLLYETLSPIICPPIICSTLLNRDFQNLVHVHPAGSIRFTVPSIIDTLVISYSLSVVKDSPN